MQIKHLFIAAAALTLTVACGGNKPKKEEPPPASEPVKVEKPVVPEKPLVAKLESKSGSKLTGTATFTQVGDKVQVSLTVSGGEPGPHGVHIHEKGDCTAGDASSAGGHFNPENKPHGAPEAAERHAGDFGNMIINKDGTGNLAVVTDKLTLSTGLNAIAGRAIIVHAKADDFGQPAGNAGDREACGVIQLE